MPSAWQVLDCELTSAGRRYTVVLGEREYIVLHTFSGDRPGWQFWNANSRTRSDVNAAAKAAILAYEREE